MKKPVDETIAAWRYLDSNVAAGVKVTIPQEEQQRENDLNNEEIYLILRGTLEPRDGKAKKLSQDVKAARRWAPWLCAYTGARVAEITRLEESDIIQEDGFYGISIKQSKTGLARKIPLHPHVIEQGFLDFVEAHGKGPLFLSEF